MTHARLLRPALLTYETAPASSSSAPCPSAPATSARLQDSATAGVPSSSAPLLAAGPRGGVRAFFLCSPPSSSAYSSGQHFFQAPAPAMAVAVAATVADL